MPFNLRRQQRDLASTADLTPIPVRGRKRPRSSTSSPSSAKSSRNSTPDPSFSQGSSSQVSKAALRASNKRAKMSSRTKPLSKIEQLPAEIIQQIFSYSVDVAFPRASPVIGQKLSSESVYRDFFERLFCSFHAPVFPPGISSGPEVQKKWDTLRTQEPYRHMRFTTLSQIFGYEDETEPDEDEMYMVQQREKALMCRWVTVERFKQYREIVLTQLQADIEKDFHDERVATPHRSRWDHPDDKQVDLWFGREFHLPTSLLRYHIPTSANRTSRQFTFLSFFLTYWPVKLDPLGDGDERARNMFCTAIKARDFRFLFLMTFHGLVYKNWEHDIHEAILGTKDRFCVAAFLRFTLKMRRFTVGSDEQYDLERSMGSWQDIGWFDQDEKVENVEKWMEEWFGPGSDEADEAWMKLKKRLRREFDECPEDEGWTYMWRLFD